MTLLVHTSFLWPVSMLPCKPIAVFSGSSWVGFCGNGQPSSTGGDNLYQQLYPKLPVAALKFTAPSCETRTVTFTDESDGTIPVNASTTKSGLKFKWSPATGRSRDDIFNPVIMADNNRVYPLTVTSRLNTLSPIQMRL